MKTRIRATTTSYGQDALAKSQKKIRPNAAERVDFVLFPSTSRILTGSVLSHYGQHAALHVKVRGVYENRSHR